MAAQRFELTEPSRLLNFCDEVASNFVLDCGACGTSSPEPCSCGAMSVFMTSSWGAPAALHETADAGVVGATAELVKLSCLLRLALLALAAGCSEVINQAARAICDRSSACLAALSGELLRGVVRSVA